MTTGRLKWIAIICFVVAMVGLLGGGWAIRKDLPPYPAKVVGPDGAVLFTKDDILAGQSVFQRYGLCWITAACKTYSRAPSFGVACTNGAKWCRPS